MSDYYAGFVVWEWQHSSVGPHGEQWICYSDQMSSLLEKQFVYGESDMLRVRIDRNVYLIDLERMIQINELSGHVRPIQRTHQDSAIWQMQVHLNSSGEIHLAQEEESKNPEQVVASSQSRQDLQLRQVHWKKLDSEYSKDLEEGFRKGIRMISCDWNGCYVIAKLFSGQIYVYSQQNQIQSFVAIRRLDQIKLSKISSSSNIITYQDDLWTRIQRYFSRFSIIPTRAHETPIVPKRMLYESFVRVDVLKLLETRSQDANCRQKCSLCMEDFEESSEVLHLNRCWGHYFHARCRDMQMTIIEYVSRSNRCPVCSTEYY